MFRRGIGYAVQGAGLFPHLTAQQNVTLVAQLEGWPEPRMQARFDELLRAVGLAADVATRLPRQLSGGMKQRVAIARALSVNPAVMLMDEPLSALDSQTRELLLDDLIELWTRERFSACYVTHNLAEAVRLGHKIIVLSRRPGRIRPIVRIDMPLDERAGRIAELETTQRHLWNLMREEARAADMELSDVA